MQQAPSLLQSRGRQIFSWLCLYASPETVFRQVALFLTDPALHDAAFCQRIIQLLCDLLIRDSSTLSLRVRLRGCWRSAALLDEEARQFLHSLLAAWLLLTR